MTEWEAQIEALWSYEVVVEKILRQSIKKRYITITQNVAHDYSEKLFEQINIDNIPGFHPPTLGENMRMEYIRVNPHCNNY